LRNKPEKVKEILSRILEPNFSVYKLLTEHTESGTSHKILSQEGLAHKLLQTNSWTREEKRNTYTQNKTKQNKTKL
jgi:hypothetical protein